jgi:hypothetical protein
MTDVPTAVTTVGATLAALGVIYGGWRRIRPVMRRGTAAVDALVGKEAVTDRSGQVLEPSQPGLVHRVATVEEAVVEFRHMVGLLTETQHTLTEHGARIKALEDARVERLVTQAESAHMWRAVADNAITDPEA